MKKHSTGGKRILVVEDEPAITDICRRVLVSEGFEVGVASDGKMAQYMLDEKQYDFCLIDIRTPTMNGKELYKWLKEKHPQLASRVMFTTGDVMSGDTESFLQQAARPFLLKPFSPGELKCMLRKAFE